MIARSGRKRVLWVAGTEDVSSADGDRYLELIADKRAIAPAMSRASRCAATPSPARCS